MLKFIVAVESTKARLVGVLQDRQGVTSLEYGVIAAVTVVVVGGLIATTGTKLTALFGNINAAL